MKYQSMFAALLLAASGTVFAQASAPVNSNATPGLDQRQANQQQRIDQGVASGQLSKREARRLQIREAKLAAHESAAKSDGVVTRRERVRLNREANANSKAIYKKKHNRRTARHAV